ncbi:MAG: biopolymer transporter ExbD [Phycisphaerae bacterium]|nr:biopolymer transporter ExbD [Phycisphaerae bacterium]
MHGSPGQGSRGRATLALNLTALIDVVFLLIMFFVLVAKFGRYPTLPLDLPRIGERTADAVDPGSRPAVDVVPKSRTAAMGGAYRFGSASFDETPAGIEALTSAVRAMRTAQPEVEISVRAERTEPYARVHPAVLAVGAAGVKHVHLMTVPEITGRTP